MTYFSYFGVISTDLKAELLQHFPINDIDELCFRFKDFHVFKKDECFWKSIYTTHISQVGPSYRHLCLDYNWQDSAIKHNMQDTINYDQKREDLLVIISGCLAVCINFSLALFIWKTY